MDREPSCITYRDPRHDKQAKEKLCQRTPPTPSPWERGGGYEVKSMLPANCTQGRDVKISGHHERSEEGDTRDDAFKPNGAVQQRGGRTPCQGCLGTAA